MIERRIAGAERRTEQHVVTGVREAKLPLDRPERWDPLLDHIGDACATERTESEELNVGQLARATRSRSRGSSARSA